MDYLIMLIVWSYTLICGIATWVIALDSIERGMIKSKLIIATTLILIIGGQLLTLHKLL